MAGRLRLQDFGSGGAGVPPDALILVLFATGKVRDKRRPSHGNGSRPSREQHSSASNWTP